MDHGGLPNPSNWCYMNASLQLLASIARYILVVNPRDDDDNDQPTDEAEELPEDCGPDQPLRHALCSLFRRLSCRGKPTNKREIQKMTATIKDLVAKRNPTFEDDDQHDAHEFIMTLLDCLHVEMNEGVGDGMAYKQVADKGKSESEVDAAMRWWRMQRAKDTSPVTESFAGMWRTAVQCSTCKTKVNNFDPLLEIQVEIAGETDDLLASAAADAKTRRKAKSGSGRLPKGARIELDDALSHATRMEDEIEGYTCASCNEGRRKGQPAFTTTVSKKTSIAVAPQAFLLLHLKRFRYDGSKVGSPVTIPQSVTLHMDGSVDLQTRESVRHKTVRYTLCGTISHHGTSSKFGHYTANVLRGDGRGGSGGRIFAHCDDETVGVTTLGTVCADESDVYLLLYERDKAQT